MESTAPDFNGLWFSASTYPAATSELRIFPPVNERTSESTAFDTIPFCILKIHCVCLRTTNLPLKHSIEHTSARQSA
jgi:hypothetical protein